ncbi:MAG TPA: ABC-F family ATP-binding cassette domain-containing protein [Stellaceae bacterium]|nr:ABC-F family ATP-binding cassette domain-containing protein [Stellaceae bacterium]
MLVLKAVTVRLGGRVVLDRATAAVPWRCRVGLVGRNGSGKSTLLRVIAGLVETDEGTVETPRGTRIGYLVQDAPGGATTPLAHVLAADSERAQLLAEAERAMGHDRLAEVQERLETIDAYAAPARAARILAGLGFDAAAQEQPLQSFSGGWRMRVALAAVLFSEPDLLLLDEPSNHLDLEAAIWLESFLKTYRGTLVVVSHERDLLNNVVDHVLHLESGKTTLYSGDYDGFVRQRRERRAQVEAQAQRQEAKRRKLQAYIDRWRYKAHTARQAQSRMKALARMEPTPEATEQAELTFDFPNPDDLRPPLVTLDAAVVGYAPGKPVLSRLTLRIDPDDRIALLGRNGSGKTTLARLLARELPLMAGYMSASGRLRVGYFAQHQIEELVSEDTPLQHMSRVLPAATPEAVRAQLARFGFSGDKATVAVRYLSGGERARLALALLTRDAPHMIILDEPTNHLDIDAREALVEALNDYAGAVIIVSHDRHLLELTADRLVVVGKGTATEFSGSLDDYRDLVLSEEDPADANPPSVPKRATRKDARRLAAQERERTQPLRDAIKEAEAEITRLSAQRSVIDQALLNPTDAGIGELLRKRAEVERQLAAAEARWLEASEALERAATGV